MFPYKLNYSCTLPSSQVELVRNASFPPAPRNYLALPRTVVAAELQAPGECVRLSAPVCTGLGLGLGLVC